MCPSLSVSRPYTACPRENSDSHFIAEVKSCWAGLMSRWATILVSMCCMPWEVRLALYSTFGSPTSAIICGLSFNPSLWFEGFSLGTLVFLPFQNRLPVKNIWPGCCALGSCMTIWQQPEAPFICIRSIPSELCPSQTTLLPPHENCMMHGNFGPSVSVRNKIQVDFYSLPS